MLHATQPSLQSFRDAFCLGDPLSSNLWAACRWRKEPNATACNYTVVIFNLSNTLKAQFKLQSSQIPYGDEDNIADISIPVESVNDTSSPNAVTWAWQKGLFNSSFIDLPVYVNDSLNTTVDLSIVPGGQISISFTSNAPFIQWVPLANSGARLQVIAGTTQPIAVWSHEEVHPMPQDANGGSFPLVGISVSEGNSGNMDDA
jgi:hypothetical protein